MYNHSLDTAECLQALCMLSGTPEFRTVTTALTSQRAQIHEAMETEEGDGLIKLQGRAFEISAILKSITDCRQTLAKLRK